jgi:hypothetical protein
MTKASQFTATWASLNHGLGGKLRGVWSSADTYYVVGEGPTAGRATDPTGTWTSYNNPPGGAMNLYCVYGINNTNVWAGSDKGQILSTTNAVTTWTEVAKAPGTPQVLGIWGSAANNIWAVTNTGKVYQWNGTALIDQTSNVTSAGNLNLRGVWGDGLGNIWVVGGNATAGFIFKH